MQHAADPRADYPQSLLPLLLAAEPDVFALAEAAEPGSKLPLLLGFSLGETLPAPAKAMLAARDPLWDKWQRSGMLNYLFGADRNGSNRWFESLKAFNHAEDDAMLVKLAVLSSDAATVVPLMMRLGYDPAADHDRPLTLAVMTGKTEILAPLANNGADIYGGRGEAFRLARAKGDDKALAALDALADSLKQRFMRKFVSQFPGGVTLEALRAPRAEDNGDVGVMTAAKAGILPGLASAGTLRGMAPQDFLAENGQGATVASVLAAQGRAEMMFDLNIWGGDAASPLLLWQALPAETQETCRAAFYATQQSAIAAENRARLARKPKAFRLKP